MNDGIIIFILLIIVVFLPLSFIGLRPQIKGEQGEAEISRILSRLRPEKFKVLNDILIINKYRSSQIDHVVVSNYGIFVIETKNYKGWIFGHENSGYWTQTFYKKKYRFRNPIIQSWGHIRTLKDALSEFGYIPYFPIVVFSGKATLKGITATVPVLYSHALIEYIAKTCTREYLSDEAVGQICQKLLQLNRVDRVSRTTHVSKARTNQQRGANPLSCPRCGARLLLKHGKYGMFYGCSTFPRCNYTRKHRN